MTKTSWLMLSLTLSTGLLSVNITPRDGQTTAFIATGVFASLLVFTLVIGRRFKFDPVLR